MVEWAVGWSNTLTPARVWGSPCPFLSVLRASPFLPPPLLPAPAKLIAVLA